MLVPDKFTSIAESILGKAKILYDQINDGVSLRALYRELSESAGSRFSIEEFIYAVEMLHVLGVIDVDLATGVAVRAA